MRRPIRGRPEYVRRHSDPLPPSPMPKPPSLPTEVIEQVLDHAGNDEANLLAIARIGPLWRDSSRLRLFKFHSVDFKDTHSLIRFAKLCQSPHCSLPKTFRGIVLRPQAGIINTITDLILVLQLLTSLDVIDSVKIDVAVKAQTVPPWIVETIVRFWTNISHLEIVGGTHSAPVLQSSCSVREAGIARPGRRNLHRHDRPSRIA